MKKLKMKRIPDIIKQTARKLRRNQTKAESQVWKLVKDRRIWYKIQRQFPLYIFTENLGLDRYIIPDFYCSEKKCIIEIDGDIHEKSNVYALDKIKEDILKEQGYNVFRITNDRVFQLWKYLSDELATYLNWLEPSSLEKRGDSEVSYLNERWKNELEKKRFTMINNSFTCENCGKEVKKHPSGSARNHCPHCLYSKHLDAKFPGDRLSECHGLMKPVWLDHRKNKGLMLVQECQKCKKKMLNRIAEDDNQEVIRKL